MVLAQAQLVVKDGERYLVQFCFQIDRRARIGIVVRLELELRERRRERIARNVREPRPSRGQAMLA